MTVEGSAPHGDKIHKGERRGRNEFFSSAQQDRQQDRKTRIEMSAPGYHSLKQERGGSPGSVEMAEMKHGSGGAGGASVADDAPIQAARVDTSESNDDEATTKHKDALSKDELRALLARKPTLDDLFFDLLFAAALSVYNSNVALDSISQVAGYMGIFALLWWSWVSCH